jgi:general secretion pathway protein M
MNASALRAQIQERLDGLAPRERWLILAAVAFAVFALVVALVVRPVYGARARAAERIGEQQLLLRDVEQFAQRFGPQVPGGAPAASSGESIVVAVDRSTRERGLGGYLKRNQPEGPDGVRLRLENVPFDDLLAWLADLQDRHGLATASASFDPSGEPGRVNANLGLVKTGR